MKLGLIGEKLSHSVSPLIHTEAQKDMGLNCDYSLIEISKENLKELIIENKGEYKGFNVTIPYKIQIMKYVDELSEEAKGIGSINTINYKDGKIFGHNTDYFGFKKMLEYNNVKVKNKKIVMLGFGGSARAVLKYLLDEKANEIKIVVRNLEKGKASLEEMLKGKVETKISLITFQELEETQGSESIVINTTPIGMYPNTDKSPITKKAAERYEVLVDLIYNPIETLFLKYGRENNKKTINGLFMLAAQGIASEEIWLEREVPNNIIEKTMDRLEKQIEIWRNK